MDISHLKTIVSSTPTLRKALPGYESTTLGLYGHQTLGIDCDEIYPNLFVSDIFTAKNKVYLQRVGITHVLNVAEGTTMVDTNAQFYDDVNIVYMGLPLEDSPYCNILCYSKIFGDYISNAISNRGKVLINCFHGRSQSIAVTVVYLRIYLGMPVAMALKMCCRERNANPNDGFLAQLVYLENYLTA